MEVLEEMNTHLVTLAYDMDMLSNPDVLRPLKDFITHLKSKGYEVRMAMWNEEDGKGIDDMFLNSKFPQIKEFWYGEYGQWVVKLLNSKMVRVSKSI